MDSSVADTLALDSTIVSPDSIIVAEDNIPQTSEKELSNDPTTREYYTQRIPETDEEKAEAHRALRDALFESGVRFKDEVNDKSLTISYLERVVNGYPDYERLADTYFQLFLACSRWDEPEKASYYKNLLIANYPTSRTAAILHIFPLCPCGAWLRP